MFALLLMVPANKIYFSVAKKKKKNRDGILATGGIVSFATNVFERVTGELHGEALGVG